MRLQRALVVVDYGLLFALLAAQESGILSHQPCNLEKFGLDDSCHDCTVFHMQMLEDGFNLTARCGWPPEGSDQRPPSEFTNRLFSVGKRPACESCNEFYQRLLGGSQPFNLTEKCGWQIPVSIVDGRLLPTKASSDFNGRLFGELLLGGSSPLNVTKNIDQQTTASIFDEGVPTTLASPSESYTCLAITICFVVSASFNAIAGIYCCVMCNRKCVGKRCCRKCLVCGRVAPKSNLKKVVIEDNRRSLTDQPFDATEASSLVSNHQNGSTNGTTNGGTNPSQVHYESTSSATLFNSSKHQGSPNAKKSVRNRRRKTN